MGAGPSAAARGRPPSARPLGRARAAPASRVRCCRVACRQIGRRGDRCEPAMLAHDLAVLGPQGLAQLALVLRAHAAVGDAGDQGLQPRLQGGALLGRDGRVACCSSRSISTSNSGSSLLSSIAWNAAAPCWRTRSSGSRPSGRKANCTLKPGLRCGSTVSTARKAARRPAASPSKHSTGSGAMRQSSRTWSSVSAVPSGATVCGKPASASAMASM